LNDITSDETAPVQFDDAVRAAGLAQVDQPRRQDGGQEYDGGRTQAAGAESGPGQVGKGELE